MPKNNNLNAPDELPKPSTPPEVQPDKVPEITPLPNEEPVQIPIEEPKPVVPNEQPIIRN